MVLYGLVQGFMAQMRITREVTYGMTWLVFSSIRGFLGVALGTLILFVFLVSVGVRLVQP